MCYTRYVSYAGCLSSSHPPPQHVVYGTYRLLGRTMKLPFVNRKQYLVIKAYTSSRRALKDVPLCLTKDVKHDGLNPLKISNDDKRYTPSFNTCYGRIATLRNSITLRTWCEFDIITTKERWEMKWPNANEYMHVHETLDEAFRPSNLFVVKVCPPWMLECDQAGTEVLHCSHILNTTHLHIASGIIPITDPTLNFFTYLPKRDDVYKIPYKMPIMQMFPLTDLPIQVECSYDANKYAELFTMTHSNPYFTGTTQKCLRHEASTI